MPRPIDNLESAFTEMYEFITDLPSGLDGFESDFDEAFKELENLKVALAQPGEPLTLDQLREMSSMKNRIRRIFSPTSEEEIKDLNQILGIHKEQIGKCSTCVHYKGSDLPGYWTDYGSCKMKSPSFLERVTHFKVSCSSYQEDIRGVEKIKRKIKDLEVLKDGKND